MKLISPCIDVSPVWEESNRKCTTILAQLRTKHNFINDIRGRLYKFVNANCSSCGENECVLHFLFHCNRFDAQRINITNEFARRGYAFTEANLNIILGAKLGNINDIQFIKNTVYEYILATGRFKEYLRLL